MQDPCLLSARALAAAIDAGTLTAAAVASAHLERIGAREPDVQAWAHLSRAQPMAEARLADHRPPGGVLRGVPFGVKDIIDSHALPTEHGSPIHRGRQPTADAACVAYARHHGGVLLGKTVTTEFAHVHPNQTRNPHNPAHTPGGSSSGSAAAVAAGMVPWAFGTQTAGSVIRPAAYCGVVGYKPSYGEINTEGVRGNVRSFDTVGVLARAVEDLAPIRSACTTEPLADIAPPDLNTLKIGFCRTPYWDQACPATQAHLEAAAQALAKAGAAVTDFALPKGFEGFEHAVRAIAGYEFAGAMAWERLNRCSQLSAALLNGRVNDGLSVSLQQYRMSLAGLGVYRAHAGLAMRGLDLLLCPSAPSVAPEGLDSTGPATFNGLWTSLYLPCITLPLFTGPMGLPIGLQLVGHYGQDLRLIAGAAAVQAALSPSLRGTQ
jgi:Asp-tRNA(Asn)/Glu-tRNA(Gln) amidotransferase A subunit family amidase